jgi:predicted protein tyrosine phosphatase
MRTHSIVVTPLSQLASAVTRWSPSHILSLASPGQSLDAVEALGHAQVLRLSFNDIEAPREALVAADESVIGRLLAFVSEWDGTAPLLIHCWFGVSRSPAAAYIAACARNPGRERQLAALLRQNAPFATPNRLMVALADDGLGRGGRMVDAIREIGRGCEVSKGEVFTLMA